MMIASFIDVLGIGLVGPYLALVMNTNNTENFFINWFIESGLAQDYNESLMVIGLLLVLVFISKATASIIINRQIFRFGNQQIVKLRTRLMQIYQNMPYTDHITRNSAEYIQATQGYSSQFVGAIIILAKWVCEGLAAISIFTFLIYSQGIIPIFLAIIIALVIGIYNFFLSSTVKLAGKIAPIENSKAIKGISESMAGFKEIKVLGIENYFTSKVHESSRIFSEQRCKEQIIAFAPRQLMESILVFSIVLLVSVSLLSGSGTETIIPALGMFGVATARLLPSATIFTTGLTSLQYYRYGISVIYKDISSYGDLPLIVEKTNLNNQSLDTFQSFELNNVSYKYPKSSRDALNEISIKIERGSSIGFIGSSGAGKTTLVDIILGILTPTAGSLNYNHLELSGSLSRWQRQIAYIPQEIFLIDDTIKNNIALGEDKNSFKKEKMLDAIKQSQLSEVIDVLPKGLDTKIGERGVLFSGGQRQRIALARAFYLGKEVLIMDEATSALDNKTEKQIVDKIKSIKHKKTIIVIAHRYSTVKDCDFIYKLENGKIVASGYPEEMLKKEEGLSS